MNLDGLASARVDLGFLTRARMALRTPDLRPAFKLSRKPVRADMREHAKKQAGPDGSWPARSSATKVRASSGRRRTRKLLGRLPAALTTNHDRRRMVVRSLVAWSAVHMTGGRVGNNAKIPARPFLWASAAVLEVVAGHISRHVAKLFERG